MSVLWVHFSGSGLVHCRRGHFFSAPVLSRVGRGGISMPTRLRGDHSPLTFSERKRRKEEKKRGNTVNSEAGRKGDLLLFRLTNKSEKKVRGKGIVHPEFTSPIRVLPPCVGDVIQSPSLCSSARAPTRPIMRRAQLTIMLLHLAFIASNNSLL